MITLFSRHAKRIKTTAIISVIAGMAGIASFVWQFHPLWLPKTNNPAFYGRWLSEYEYPNDPGRVNIKGITEYLENGTFRYSGLMTVKLPEMKSQVIFRVSSTGEWDGNEDRVIIKLSDFKGDLKEIESGEMTISAAQYAKWTGDKGKFEEVLKGTPEEFRVHRIEDDKLTLSVSDLDGNPVIFDMVRTLKRIL